MVHFILGNHEVLNLEGRTEYVNKKYTTLAHKYSGKENPTDAYLFLMNDDQELVRWMKSKNAIERIGDILFVHGGISPELVDTGFRIDQINDIIRSRLKKGSSANPSLKMDEDFLFASHGPLWYRGLASRYRNFYKKVSVHEVDKALKHFNVNHICIGHTIAAEVSFDFDGKVIRTDVQHNKDKGGQKSQGLLVKNDQFYRVNGLGKVIPLNKKSTSVVTNQ